MTEMHQLQREFYDGSVTQKKKIQEKKQIAVMPFLYRTHVL